MSGQRLLVARVAVCVCVCEDSGWIWEADARRCSAMFGDVHRLVEVLGRTGGGEMRRVIEDRFEYFAYRLTRLRGRADLGLFEVSSGPQLNLH